jgi:hypothetical protein
MPLIDHAERAHLAETRDRAAPLLRSIPGGRFLSPYGVARRAAVRSFGVAACAPGLLALGACTSPLGPRSDSATWADTESPSTAGPGTEPPASIQDSADAGRPVPTGYPILTPFSLGTAAIGPGRWEPWGRHPAKPATHYEIVREANRPVLLARSRSSVSGLKHRVDRPASDFSGIRWRWRIDAALQGADVGARHAEDAPARLLLAFDGDRSKLGMKDLLLSEQFLLFTGSPLPYATLMYVWDGARPEGEVVHNPHTPRIRKVIVQSGTAKAGRWIDYERDFHADFHKAFGEAPGRLVGVGVMTDSDNTRQSARCLYGDVQLLSASGAFQRN